MKKALMSLGAAGIVSVAGILVGVKPTHASTTTVYSCTRTLGTWTYTINTRSDVQEDNLSSRGWTCTGDKD